MLTLRGDGFSAHAGDVEVQLGGAHCRVVWANVTHVSCITPRAADLSVSSAATVSLTVSGLSASCDAPCTFGYDRSRTPVITAATVTSQAPGSDWSIELTGAFGTGSDFPSDASVLVGPTPCSRMSQVPWIAAAFAATHRSLEAHSLAQGCPRGPRGVPPRHRCRSALVPGCILRFSPRRWPCRCVVASVTASLLSCDVPPPLSGAQTVRITSAWGNGLGEPALPTIQGLALTASSFSPSATSLAGGATLTIAGGGFSASETSVLDIPAPLCTAKLSAGCCPSRFCSL